MALVVPPSSSFRTSEESRASSISFADVAHNKDLLNTFCSLREQGELCDVVLQVGSARLVAHRVILAGSSPYFRAMFTNGLAESRQEKITLQDMNEKVFSEIIDCFYTSKIEISESNVQDLLSISGLLQLKRVQEACCEFMKRQINTENCLGIAAFADTHSCINLASTAESFARNHFCDVVQKEEFMMISCDQMLRLISDDSLNVHSEERVFEAVLAWIKHDLSSRQVFASELFSHVRFPLLSPEFLMDRVANEDVIRNNRACSDLLIEATRLLLLPRERAQSSCPRTMPRKPVALQQVLFAIGGMSRRETMRSGERFDPKEGKWKPIGDMIVRRWGAAVASLGPYLYICGGSDDQSRLGSVERYDPFNNVWLPAPPMTTNRNGVGVAAGHGKIYAVGGFDGSSPLNTAESFDPKVNKWTEMPRMNQSRFGVGCCVLNDHVYAVGGFDGVNLKTVERYDYISNQWSEVAQMNVARKHVVCAALGGYIYAIGGNDHGVRFSSVERYDPSRDQWVEVASMLSPRSGCGVGVVDGFIYVVGGYDGSQYLSTSERYDPLSNQWHPAPAMTQARDYVAVCVSTSKRVVNKRMFDPGRSPSPPVGASHYSALPGYNTNLTQVPQRFAAYNINLRLQSDCPTLLAPHIVNFSLIKRGQRSRRRKQ